MGNDAIDLAVPLSLPHPRREITLVAMVVPKNVSRAKFSGYASEISANKCFIQPIIDNELMRPYYLLDWFLIGLALLSFVNKVLCIYLPQENVLI